MIDVRTVDPRDAYAEVIPERFRVYFWDAGRTMCKEHELITTNVVEVLAWADSAPADWAYRSLCSSL